jgi:peptidoglycan/LPS O-acetylase OafA/YrhL
MVVTYHISSNFAGYLNSPALEENGPVATFQYPFLRLIVGGRAAICLFFIITGYVNSLSTIKHTRNGDPELALINLSKSTFTRTGRLVIPTNAALCVSWLVCQLNLHRLASRIDSYWIRAGSHEPGPTFLGSINRLLRNLTLFWHAGESEYDGTYWTIPFFLKGSMLVYLALLATRFAKPRYTKVILIFLYCYAWSGGQGM